MGRYNSHSIQKILLPEQNSRQNMAQDSMQYG